MLAHIRAGFDNELLVFAIDKLAHPFYKQSFGVALENGIPLAAPKNLDDVPAGTAKSRLKLLNDLSVAAHGTIETLQVAVNDEDQIIELLARREGDGAERFRLIGFAVAEESPNFCVRGRLESAILEIAAEARLINSHQRAQSHGYGRKFPELGHQPRVRIGREPAAGL